MSDCECTSLKEKQTSQILRLGKCEVCRDQNAKYTCPKCEVKSCSIRCLNIHKVELNCSGIRDRTKFVPLRKMSNMDFMSDYYFLEECTHFLENRKRDKLKRQTRYNKVLPTNLYHLRNAAQKRNTTLKFLLNFFTRHKENSTSYDFKNDTIYWRIKWIFTNAENLSCIDERCSENIKISELLDKYLNLRDGDGQEYKTHLQFYQSKGIANSQILLKAEGIKRSKDRFYTMDCTKTLKENLESKTIVEYPCFHVMYDCQPGAYDTIDSDEDVETETKLYAEKLEKTYRQSREDTRHTTSTFLNDGIQFKQNIKEIKIQNQQTDQKNFENMSTNYLFTDERVLDVLSSDSDGNVTEEEQIMQ